MIERNWLNGRLTGLISVEKYKYEFSDRSSKPLTDLADSPLHPNTYKTIRKDLQTFSNIHHHRTTSELLSPKSDIASYTDPLAAVRSPSSLSFRHRIGALLGKSRPRHKK